MAVTDWRLGRMCRREDIRSRIDLKPKWRLNRKGRASWWTSFEVRRRAHFWLVGCSVLRTSAYTIWRNSGGNFGTGKALIGRMRSALAPACGPESITVWVCS
ncbi:hypothetical protein Tdes44962_MAKER10471 [Teratosphaeria destructans]|uniref:Uncharacterized protein n=1 Tax=Teratosphaeria destructans TaxID=418781 RepID=A0A9W7T217_9PEZI|nr:hypothetical protein Tdes44962_MAKER10471 [Teratosphaeria destructans]